MYINALGTVLTASAAWNSIINSGQVQLGTIKNDILNLSASNVGKGGKGDDSYNLWTATAAIVEEANEGIDTAYIQYWGKATLAANVENMVLVSKGATAGTGNALDNIITAGVTGATLNGKGGNDVLVGGAGADVFVVEKGNGSDAIVNFKPGADAILLQGYGFTGFGQIKAAATQVGADVSVALGGGEKLVIRGVQLSGLKAADFGMMEANQILQNSDSSLVYRWDSKLAAFDPTPITLVGVNKGWNANGWYVLNNMWGTQGLKDGVDYTINSTFSRGDMTKNVTFNWSVPYTTDYASPIKGYPEVAFGVPPKGNYASNPTDKAAVFPVKVSDLASVTAKYDVSWSGTTSGFNVSYDIWLTNKPNGDASTITNEIMVWVHKGAFGAPGDLVGTMTVNGVNASIYHTGTYTAVILDQDSPTGTVDVTAILAKLQTLGIVSPTEYLAAIELGAEMNSGVGSLTINDLDLTVVSRGAGGMLVTKEVGGDRTTVTEMPQLSLKYAAGTEQLVDANGVATGTKVTTFDATDKVSVKYLDKAGKMTAYDLVKVDQAGVMTTQHYTASGKLTGADVVKVAPDKTTTTEHYDANWKFAGYESVKYGTDGSVSTARYDAAWKLVGTDVVKTTGTAVTTLSYDAAWKLLSQEMAQTNKDGTTTTQHFDGAGKLQGIDVIAVTGGKTTLSHYNSAWALTGVDVKVVDANGNVNFQHYDKNWKILSAEAIVANADGSITTTRYTGSSWSIAGYDVEKVDANGVTSTTHYNNKWQVTSIEHEGSAGADTLAGGVNTTDLHGGRGSDTLIGGGGKTNFWFDTAIGNGDVDQISKFTVAKDDIYLSQSIFSGIKSLGDLSASAFAVGSAATSADTRIIFDKVTGNVFYDADGTGAGAAILFAHIDADKALTAANFHVVA